MLQGRLQDAPSTNSLCLTCPQILLVWLPGSSVTLSSKDVSCLVQSRFTDLMVGFLCGVKW